MNTGEWRTDFETGDKTFQSQEPQFTPRRWGPDGKEVFLGTAEYEKAWYGELKYTWRSIKK